MLELCLRGRDLPVLMGHFGVLFMKWTRYIAPYSRKGAVRIINRARDVYAHTLEGDTNRNAGGWYVSISEALLIVRKRGDSIKSPCTPDIKVFKKATYRES